MVRERTDLSTLQGPSPPDDDAPATPARGSDGDNREWRHIGALDGLRALAVLAVLAFHDGRLQGGFLGVDLFFALSGFLITTLLLRDVVGGGLSLGGFWARRFRRLLPAVLVMITVVALWAWAFGTPAELDRVRTDGPWAVVYLANWHLIDSSGGYWASFTEPSMFNHLWSLAIEEQFYLVWPLVVWLIARGTRDPERVVLITATCAIAASVVAMALLVGDGDPTRVYMGTDTRATSILVGAVLATAPARRVVLRVATRLRGSVDVVLAVLLGAVGVAWIGVDGATSRALFHGGLAFHSAAAATIVAFVVAAPTARIVAALAHPTLQWVGRLSYGLYLWHWPVYVVLSPARAGFEGWSLTAVRVMASFALAAVSLRYVEDPIRRHARWARNRRGVVVLAGSLATALLLFVAIPRPQGEIATFDPGSITTPTTGSAVVATTMPAPTTNPGGATVPDSTTPATAPRPTVAGTTTTAAPPTSTVAPLQITSVFWDGDSIAYDLAPAVDAALGGSGVPVEIIAAPGGRLIASGGNASGIEGLAAALDAAATVKPVVVVQLSVWDADQPRDQQEGALRELRDVVVSRGLTLVMITPPPVRDDLTGAHLASLVSIARQIDAADPSVVLLDQSEVWGDALDLDLDDDGTPERKRDGVHMCPSGAARFAAWLDGRLAALSSGMAVSDPVTWASAAWITDPRYDDPVGACAPL